MLANQTSPLMPCTLTEAPLRSRTLPQQAASSDALGKTPQIPARTPEKIHYVRSVKMGAKEKTNNNTNTHTHTHVCRAVGIRAVGVRSGSLLSRKKKEKKSLSGPPVISKVHPPPPPPSPGPCLPMPVQNETHHLQGNTRTLLLVFTFTSAIMRARS